MNDIKTLFPSLSAANHRVTSARDPFYNCVAWSMGDSLRWWQPHAAYYWPNELCLTEDEEPKVEHVVKAFTDQGFEPVKLKRGKDANATEGGFDRIAIYGNGEQFKHVTHQLDSGWWASKLGDWEDIEHESLAVLESAAYGQVSVVMRRSKSWTKEKNQPAA